MRGGWITPGCWIHSSLMIIRRVRLSTTGCDSIDLRNEARLDQVWSRMLLLSLLNATSVNRTALLALDYLLPFTMALLDHRLLLPSSASGALAEGSDLIPTRLSILSWSVYELNASSEVTKDTSLHVVGLSLRVCTSVETSIGLRSSLLRRNFYLWSVWPLP